jgi:GMP synthase-like glutamine amidotransferase
MDTSDDPHATRSRRVALLACDHPDQSLIDIDGDYTDMFVRVFAADAPHIDFEVFDVIGGAPLPRVGEHDAILITGSRLGATDDLPWIEALRTVIRDAHARRVPLVGVCFGHQLIADALGGRVERAGAGWGVGVHHATVTVPVGPSHPGCGDFRLLVSHQDQVVALPDDAELIATSDHAPIAAFRIGSLLGVQGHPEFSARYAAALMDARRDRIPADVVTHAEASLTTPTDHGAVVRWLGRHLAGTPVADAGR